MALISSRACFTVDLRLQACQPRDAQAASLIRLDVASHPATEARADSSRVPAGLEYWSVDVQITQLEVVFLYRFLQVRVQPLPWLAFSANCMAYPDNLDVALHVRYV